MNAKIEYYVKEYKECDSKAGREMVDLLAKTALNINEHIEYTKITGNYLLEIANNLINK